MSVEVFNLQAEEVEKQRKGEKEQPLSAPLLHQFLQHMGEQFLLADYHIILKVRPS